MMERRKFIGSGLALGTLTGLGFISGTASGCDTQEKTPTSSDQFELNEYTVTQLLEDYASKKRTVSEVVQAYLTRIEHVDKTGFALNSVLSIHPNVLDEARKMDEKLKDGSWKQAGRLFGVPILIKDNIDTEGLATTAGSIALKHHKPKKDAPLIAALKREGAVILGKTNLSEWANFRSTKSSSGWSSLGGQTKNPYGENRNPLGSSAGSGVAAAANLALLTIGTETDGSIVCPSSVNNIVGIKPTVGLVSQAGIIPISHTQDTAGPMCRTVSDAALVLDVIADGKKTKNAYTESLNKKGARGKRIGFDPTLLSQDKRLNLVFEEAKKVLRKLGAELVPVEFSVLFGTIGTAEFEVLLHEFKWDLAHYLETHETGFKTLSDLIAFNKKHEKEAMPYFGQELFELAETKEDLESDAYKTAIKNSHFSAQTLLDSLFKDNKLDALIGLTFGVPHTIDVIYGDQFGDVSFTTPAAVAGYPHITVPGGWAYELPVGLSFVGLAYEEAKLIEMAYSFEQETGFRRSPKV